MTKKSVFSVVVKDAKSKRAAMKVVSGFLYVDSLSIDMEKKTLTVLGDIDPAKVVSKLTLFCAEIVTVGQIEEKGDKKKKEGDNDKSKQQEEMEKIIRAHFNAHYPNYYYPYPRYVSIEEDPRSCIIL